MNLAATSDTPPKARAVDRLTLFTFLWACQGLIHQEFYSGWLRENDPLGWIVTALALATLIQPRSLLLFTGMLVSSMAYNINKWPFVVNHILVETVINLTIVTAIVVEVVRARSGSDEGSTRLRDSIYDRFAPVVLTMLVIVYYFAFLAKLNWDFVNPEVSCVAVMYADMVERFPFLPVGESAHWMAIMATLIVEAAIPLLLTFRRTRYAGVLLGVPFHVGLGLVGHRTFSGLAFALYALFLMPDLLRLVTAGGKAIGDRLGSQWPRRLHSIGSIGFALLACALIAADFTGNYRGGIGPLKIYRVAWVVWLLWSFGMGTAFAWCAWQAYVKRNAAGDLARSSRPGWLWVALVVVVLNGMSQYLGFKTETCFTMYSNLRTEGEYNNHMFMPAWRLADYQSDLVEIVETTHPDLTKFVGSEQLLTYFELRRIVSRSEADFELTYRRNGRIEQLHRRGDDHTDSELFTRHPLWQAKLLFFRPVPTGQCAACQH